jgi:DNA-binding LacI/PurR family transcriptional regulator
MVVGRRPEMQNIAAFPFDPVRQLGDGFGCNPSYKTRSVTNIKTTVTSHDVARLAQVSQSAVSRTFTPGASVSPATRAKVQDAARKLGYRPNAIARTLSTRRSRIIGLVISRLDNLFYPIVLEQLSQRLRRDGYHVLLFVTDARETDNVMQEILQYQVDGIVMMSTVLSSGLAGSCAVAGIPVVLFNRMSYKPVHQGYPAGSVTSDNYEGGRAVAHYLVESGHQKVAFIAGLEVSSTSLERESGFREGLREKGRRCFARSVGNFSFDDAKLAARDLFSSRLGDDALALPDAVFVASDHMAFAVMDVLRMELNLRIPEDVSVVGFDNVPQAAWGSYQLTTVEQNIPPMVEAAVSLLLDQITGGAKTESITVPCQLLIRSSSRTIPTPLSA